MKPQKEAKKESVKITLNKRLERNARRIIYPAGRSLSEYIEDLIAQDLRRAGLDPYEQPDAKHPSLAAEDQAHFGTAQKKKRPAGEQAS